MERERVLQLLAQHKPQLAQRYGVLRLALFGSTARDSANAESDIDILVAFDGPATSQRYFGVQFYLEDLLDRPVDLVTEKALRPELRPHIEREALHV
ncbi:MAG: nucleotidyltransferase family protein [Gammaproteobacteria bacterium]|jgi:predicted nucleotidyltransferase|nr:nucleotidyltransferase family protein [Gammaproteobacteria bacterium]